MCIKPGLSLDPSQLLTNWPQFFSDSPNVGWGAVCCWVAGLFLPQRSLSSGCLAPSPSFLRMAGFFSSTPALRSIFS